MANQALIAQLIQLANQLNVLHQTVGTLQTSNITLTTRVAALEAENATLTTAKITHAAQVATLGGGTAAGGAAGGGAGAAAPVTFAATPAMVNHQDFDQLHYKSGNDDLHGEECEKLTTEFDIKSGGTVVYITELQAKCVKMGWHMGTQQIINLTNAADSIINTIHQYGQINFITLQAQCKVFCKSTGALFQARAKQNNTMIAS
jgi:hypothetical protein